MNAFSILGIREALDIREDELRAAYREAGKKFHPDAGGAEGEFTALREAMAILGSPSKRLSHWFLLRGVKMEPRGAISAELMDLFGRIGAISQEVEGVIRKKEAAQSALGRALLEPEVQHSMAAVENLIAEISSMLEQECSEFGVWDQAAPDAAAGSEKTRNLAFLEKWQASLKSLYSRLI